MLPQTVLCNQLLVSIAILLSMDRVVSENDLQLDQIVNLKNSGGIGCVLAVHPEVENCKGKYTQRVSLVVEAGHPMDSVEYRREMCCGFWRLRDCVADSARQKCDTKSAKTIANMKIYSSDHENVLHKRCDGFEYDSRQCSTAYPTHTISLWTLIICAFIVKLVVIGQ